MFLLLGFDMKFFKRIFFCTVLLSAACLSFYDAHAAAISMAVGVGSSEKQYEVAVGAPVALRSTDSSAAAIAYLSSGASSSSGIAASVADTHISAGMATPTSGMILAQAQLLIKQSKGEISVARACMASALSDDRSAEIRHTLLYRGKPSLGKIVHSSLEVKTALTTDSVHVIHFGRYKKSISSYNKCIRFMIDKKTDKTAYVEALYITAEELASGEGKILMAAMLDMLARHGIQYVFFMINPYRTNMPHATAAEHNETFMKLLSFFRTYFNAQIFPQWVEVGVDGRLQMNIDTYINIERLCTIPTAA